MPTSEARILANRANSLKSKGPTSVEGRRIAARNSLKHGMAGRGVVLPDSDAAEVERRNEALQAELAPATEMGEVLVHRLAMLSVRMEKGARHASASSARRVRHAAEDFDEDRIDRAEDLLEGIAENPRRSLRKLRRMPEGVDLLVAEWGDLRADLTRQGRPCWTASHLERAAHLLGIRSEDARTSGIGALSRAAWGDFEALGDHEGRGLDDDARKALGSGPAGRADRRGGGRAGGPSRDARPGVDRAGPGRGRRRGVVRPVARGEPGEAVRVRGAAPLLQDVERVAASGGGGRRASGRRSRPGRRARSRPGRAGVGFVSRGGVGFVSRGRPGGLRPPVPAAAAAPAAAVPAPPAGRSGLRGAIRGAEGVVEAG